MKIVLINKKCLVFIVLNKLMMYNKGVGSFEERVKLIMNEKSSDFSGWFPGHMKKARYLIVNNLKNVDIVFEVLDARAPIATKNKMINEITKNRLRLVILAKNDLAEEKITKLWVGYFKKKNVFAVDVDCKDIKQTKKIIDISLKLLKNLETKRNKKNKSNGRFRAMVVGVPNVGKSTLINSLAKKKKTKVGNFPGVTKSEQWVFVDEKIDLLDTPGNLSFEDRYKDGGFILELLGSVKAGCFDEEEVAFNLLKFLKENKLKIFNNIFNFKDFSEGENLLEQYGKFKNMLKRGAEIDTIRAARAVLKDFKEGKFGRITLEVP